MIKFVAIILILFTSSALADSGVSFSGVRKFNKSSGVTGLDSCTPGTDCYCDCVSNSTLGASSACTTKWGSNIYDSSLILCEDSEAPPLWDFANHTSYVGDGAPYYGPPYDDTGDSGFRGLNTYWQNKYGNANAFGAWSEGNPASPTYGVTCNPDPGTPNEICTWEIILGDANPWQAGVNTAALRIMIDGTGPFIGTLTGGNSPSGDVWAGNASFEGLQQYERQGAHWGQDTFSDATEIGVTMAAYWSSNVASSGLIGDAVKGWEFADGTFPGYGEWITNGRVSGVCGSSSHVPFSGFFWYGAGTTFADFSGATNTVGSVCDGGTALVMVPSWTRPSDFFGKWFCVRYHVTGMGTSNVSVKVYDPTVNNDTAKVLDVSNINGAKLMNQAYDFIEIQANNNAGGATQTEDTSQGFDNAHIRRGAPVPCSQIGF